jgi:protein SCO1/2
MKCTISIDLPVLNNYIDDNGIKQHYLINNFNFITQDGDIFTHENTKNKVQIANFFFTSCSSICPPMREKLINIASKFDKKDLLLLSFTIDIKNDSIEDLKKYSISTGISKDKWYFLKGNQNELSKMALKFKTSFRNVNNSIDFYHSSFVVLIDNKQQIRGFYDILNNEEAKNLEDDINVLLKNI